MGTSSCRCFKEKTVEVSQIRKIGLAVIGISFTSVLLFNLFILLFARDDVGYYKMGMIIFSVIAIPVSVAISGLLYYLATKGKFLNHQIIRILSIAPLIGVAGFLLTKSAYTGNLMFWSGWMWFLLWLNMKYLNGLLK